MKAHLWNIWTDSVILTGDLCTMMNKALALMDRGCLTFGQFEITNYGEHYLPWEPDFTPVTYKIVED